MHTPGQIGAQLHVVITAIALWIGSPSISLAQDLLVSSAGTDSIKRYAWPSGAFIGDFVSPSPGGLSHPAQLRFRPSPPRNLFVASNDPTSNSILEFNGADGSPIGVFVPAASGGLAVPWALAWRSNGDLFVTSELLGGAPGAGECVREFNGTTGAFENLNPCEFTLAAAGQSHALAFRSNDNLLVAWEDLTGYSPINQIREYQYEASVDYYFYWRTIGPGDVGPCHGLAIGPNGNLFASLRDTDQVVQVSMATGTILSPAFVGVGAGGLDAPGDLVFGPNGNLLVVSSGTNQVIEYNGTTGAYVRAFVTAGSGGLSEPTGLAFVPACAGPQPAPVIVDLTDETRSIACPTPNTGTCTPALAAYIRCATVENTACAAPVTWSLVFGPPGMSVTAATGAVVWPSVTAGTFPITISATNSVAVDTESWTLTILAGPLPGDLTCDGLIDGADIGAFTACLVAGSPAGGCAAADLDSDGDVDADDLALFVAAVLG